MNASKPENLPPSQPASETDNSDAIVVFAEGEEDTTVRPVRPELRERLDALRKLLGLPPLPPPAADGPNAST